MGRGPSLKSTAHGPFFSQPFSDNLSRHRPPSFVLRRLRLWYNVGPIGRGRLVWSMARVWKARMGQTIAGSNPALSAKSRHRPSAVSFVFAEPITEGSGKIAGSGPA